MSATENVVKLLNMTRIAAVKKVLKIMKADPTVSGNPMILKVETVGSALSPNRKLILLTILTFGIYNKFV